MVWMTDTLTAEERSKRMSLIRGKWTKQEKKVHNYLKGRKIKHKMHPKLSGNPDIIIPDGKVAVFLDGCFWHGCKVCKQGGPQTRKGFWKDKIYKNIKRDSEASKALKKSGWHVVRIWEHEISNIDNVIAKITKWARRSLL